MRDNPNAIGYDGLGYVTPEVKVLAVAKEPDGPVRPAFGRDGQRQALTPSRATCTCTPRRPRQRCRKDYLDWIFTAEAQKIVTELGFVPVR